MRLLILLLLCTGSLWAQEFRLPQQMNNVQHKNEVVAARLKANDILQARYITPYIAQEKDRAIEILESQKDDILGNMLLISQLHHHFGSVDASNEAIKKAHKQIKSSKDMLQVLARIIQQETERGECIYMQTALNNAYKFTYTESQLSVLESLVELAVKQAETVRQEEQWTKEYVKHVILRMKGKKVQKVKRWLVKGWIENKSPWYLNYLSKGTRQELIQAII